MFNLLLFFKILNQNTLFLKKKYIFYIYTLLVILKTKFNTQLIFYKKISKKKTVVIAPFHYKTSKKNFLIKYKLINVTINNIYIKNVNILYFYKILLKYIYFKLPIFLLLIKIYFYSKKLC